MEQLTAQWAPILHSHLLQFGLLSRTLFTRPSVPQAPAPMARPQPEQKVCLHAAGWRRAPSIFLAVEVGLGLTESVSGDCTLALY